MSHRRRSSTWVLVLWLVVSPAAAEREGLFGRVVHIADGDTLTLDTGDAEVRIRLYQIDAPEHDQPGSAAARQALTDKVDGKYVRVQVATVDDYGRIVGTVWLGNQDVNRELVREGHAWAYRRYLKDRSLLADEAAARDAGRGLWGLGDPVAPWEWRHGGRDAARRASGDDCRIKGNVSRRGERIYHLPGDEHYEQTRIDTARGERWFCSAAEAERAGWRHAR